MTMARVVITRAVQKALRKMPRFVAEHLAEWALAVQTVGLHMVQTHPGYHDEKLRGDRTGQHSIRLNRGNRAFYEITEDREIVVTVIEVNKHEY